MREANLLSALVLILKKLIGLIFTISKLMAILKTRIRWMQTQIATDLVDSMDSADSTDSVGLVI